MPQSTMAQTDIDIVVNHLKDIKSDVNRLADEVHGDQEKHSDFRVEVREALAANAARFTAGSQHMAAADLRMDKSDLRADKNEKTLDEHTAYIRGQKLLFKVGGAILAAIAAGVGAFSNWASIHKH